MLGSVKYPEIYSKVFSKEHQCNRLKEEDLNNPRKVKAGDWKPPKCIFDEDEYILEWILEPFNVEDQKLFRKIEKINGKHNKPINKSFDTSIMDLSDDIAYGIHDLEDALALRIITRDSWDEEVVCKLNNLGTSLGYEDMSVISNDLFSKEAYKRKSVIGGLVNWFVTSIHVGENERFEHSFLKYNAKFSEKNKGALSILKNYVIKHVIKSTEVQLLEYKGQQMVIEIFEALSSDPERLLPEYTKKFWREAKEKGDTKKSMRVICDYIAGMTDDYASKIHRALFVAGDGSIFNRL